MKVYHYPACQTCKKAIAWAAERGEQLEQVHIVETPPTRAQLERWWRASGKPLKALFNTSGQSWKALDLTARWNALDEDTKLDLLAADGKLIRRPILVLSDDHALFGFKQDEWSEYMTTDTEG
jgi:arsenate reductase